MICTSVDSPCISLCVYDYDRDYCTGCGRHLDEISNWDYYTPEQKQEILKKCEKRLDALT